MRKIWQETKKEKTQEKILKKLTVPQGRFNAGDIRVEGKIKLKYDEEESADTRCEFITNLVT